MSTDATSLPNDVSLLKEIIAQQQETLAQLSRQNQQLECRLDQLLRRFYGPRAERVDPSQMALFDLEPEEPAVVPAPVEQEPDASPKTKKKFKGHGRRAFPKEIERREILLDIPDAEKTCPCCGQPRREIGRVVTERLGFDPARFYVNRYVQLKYACPCERSGVITAEKPISPIERGNAEPDLLAFTAVSRFDDHSPYYRQENGQFKRAGIDVPRSTQCDWMRQIAELLTPLYERMHDRVLASDVLGTDDTPVPLVEKGRGKTRQAYFWAYRGDENYPYDVFDFTAGRSRAGPMAFLRRDEADDSPSEGSRKSFHGYLQADAFPGYDVLFEKGDIVEVGCWAHARRKFFEAKETDLPRGMEALARIRQLYDVERESKDLAGEPASDDRLAECRLALRREKARPLLDAFKNWLDEHARSTLPKSAMGQAIRYGLSNWDALCRYTDDGRLPIDNNAVERMLRIVALGRKNWLFAGSERGGRTAAILFTILSSAKRHGRCTWSYLHDVLVRLADLKPGELEELLPDRWHESQPAAA
jgi:transposase